MQAALADISQMPDRRSAALGIGALVGLVPASGSGLWTRSRIAEKTRRAPLARRHLGWVAPPPDRRNKVWQVPARKAPPGTGSTREQPVGEPPAAVELHRAPRRSRLKRRPSARQATARRKQTARRKGWRRAGFWARRRGAHRCRASDEGTGALGSLATE